MARKLNEWLPKGSLEPATRCPIGPPSGQLKAAGMALDLLPHDQQIQIVE